MYIKPLDRYPSIFAKHHGTFAVMLLYGLLLFKQTLPLFTLKTSATEDMEFIFYHIRSICLGDPLTRMDVQKEYKWRM